MNEDISSRDINKNVIEEANKVNNSVTPGESQESIGNMEKERETKSHAVETQISQSDSAQTSTNNSVPLDTAQGLSDHIEEASQSQIQSTETSTSRSSQSPQKTMFSTRVNSVLSKLDYEHCEPDMVVNMLRSPSTKIVSALHTKLKRCDAEWMEGFLDNNGFNVSGNRLIIKVCERNL